MTKIMKCIRCTATAKNTAKERGRFARRHPVAGECVPRKPATKGKEG